jgi:sugar lactone lactonase YvrE
MNYSYIWARELNKLPPTAVKVNRFILQRLKSTFLKSTGYAGLILIVIACLFTACNKNNVKIVPGKYDPNAVPPTGNTTTNTGGTTTNPDSSSNALPALFSLPSDVAIDAGGNLYVADYGNNMIRKITPDGIVSALAGNGSNGFQNGTGTQATFNGPTGIAVDAAGNVYVADFHNNLIRKVTPAGVVSTLAGTVTNPADSTVATQVSVFSGPSGVAVDASGNVYVADSGNNEIKMVAPDGTVNTLAGNANPGSNDGTGAAASFYNPTGVALDAAGNLYVADFLNNLIRKIAPGGVVTTIAGNASIGSSDGSGAAASFYFPNSLAVDASGNVFVTDDFNNLIRKISPSGQVTTIAGTGLAGSLNGISTAASFNDPDGIAVDASGNLYIADADNNLIRKITPAGVVTTLAGVAPAVTAVHAARNYYHSGIMLHKIARAKMVKAQTSPRLFR